MSYILDALRKLEQNRQHGESLTFLAFQGQTPKKPQRRLWPYLLVAALLANAGAIFWWTGFRQPAGTAIPAQPPAVRGVEQAIPAPGPAAVGRERAGDERAGDGKRVPAPKEAEGPPRPAGKGMIAAARSPVGPAPAPSEKPSPAPPISAEVAPPADGRVLKPADLPASVARVLPEFKVSLHYYIAEPQARVVLINDRTLHEGEYLSEGLKVEQISEGGVVMDYRGWRFQVGLNGSR